MKKKHLVLFFKPILNWILGHIYTLLLLFLTGITILALPFVLDPIIFFLTSHKIKLSSFQESVLSELIISVFPSIMTGIFFLLTEGNYKNSRRIKRKLYNICSFLYKSIYSPRLLKKIISFLVNLFYFHKRELIKTQQNIVDDILDSLNKTESSQKRIYWLLGSSYSGKTTTILNLLIDLISKMQYNQLFNKLDGNIVYFDLGDLSVSLEDLQKDYEREKFSNCLIVIDNLHKLSGKSCLHILENVVLHLHAYALIVLLRNPEEFLTENDRVSELKKIIIENGKKYELRRIKPNDFEICQEEQFLAFCRGFFDADQITERNEMVVHLYILYLKKDLDTFKILTQIQLFVNCNGNALCTISSELIAIIACSLFVGSFNLELLSKCLPHISELKLRKLLDLLKEIGFLTNYPNSVEYFFFHEQIAKYYFKESIKEEKYQKIYFQVFQKLSNEYTLDKNSILNFLYCMLAQEVGRAKKIFQQVVTNVNFLNLYEEMMFLFELHVCNIDDYYNEIGILCDRCGKLKEARTFYSRYFDKDKNADAFYKLVQIDHKTIEKYPEIENIAINSSDLYIRSLSAYWKIHTNMHRGVFQFQKMFDLACEFQENAGSIIAEHPYDGLHLMRRLYFDLFRLYYLEGIFQPEKLKMFTENYSNMFRILKNKLDEFQAYYIKFAIGLMLGQDVLFSLAFEKKGLDLEQYSFLFGDLVNIEHSKTFDLNAIAQETIRNYLQAIELLDKVGDKTSIFVKYHMYNIKLILVKDGDYSECERFYEDYMTFATRENILEYQAYAETFKLKMSLIQLCSPSIIESYGNDQYDELISTIQQKMTLAQKYEELANPGFGNQYARLRLKFYSALFLLFIKKISTKKFKKEIQDIKKIALKRNYNRELKIISYIKNYNYQLSPESIRIIFSFYPIVPQ